jgi:hypothetical protein
MPTVTTAPVSPLARLRGKVPPLPPPTAAERARWRKIAADRSPVVVTDDAPDVSIPTPGLIECAAPVSFPIDDRLAAWFDAHGGARAVLKALRSYMREHARDAGSTSRRSAPSITRRARR